MQDLVYMATDAAFAVPPQVNTILKFPFKVTVINFYTLQYNNFIITLNDV